MRLKKLIAHNFTLLESLEIEFSPEVTVLIGANYAGKSSIIDALLLFRDALSNHSINNALGMRGGFERVVSWRDALRSVSLETHLTGAADEQVLFRFEFDAQGPNDERIILDGKTVYEMRVEGTDRDNLTYVVDDGRMLRGRRSLDWGLAGCGKTNVSQSIV